MESPWRWRQRMELHSHKAKNAWPRELAKQRPIPEPQRSAPCRPLAVDGCGHLAPGSVRECVLFEATWWWLVMVAQGH